MKKLIVVSLAMLALLLLMFWMADSFNQKIAGTTVNATAAPTPEQLLTLSWQDVDDSERFSGTLRARQQAQLASRITAEVAQILVSSGQQVQQGDLLIRLASPDLDARVNQQQQAISAAQAQLNEVRAQYRRISALYERKLVSRAELDKADAQLKTAQASLSQQLGALTEAQATANFSLLSAPFDGVIAERFADAGETVTPGQRLLSLYNPASIRLEAPVREAIAIDLRLGDVVMVEIPSLKQQRQALVDEIVPAADSGSRSLLVKVALENTEGLFPGMFARLHIPQTQQSMLLIPKQAIQRLGQIEQVEVWNGQQRELRLIRTRDYQGDSVQVLAGLTAGEQLILNSSAP